MTGHIVGHYEVAEKIGAGGMGEVYRARDLQLDRDVALKVLPAGTLDDEAARRQFRREALALAKLNHPTIATVHEFSQQDGVDLIVMELIPGVTLDRRLDGGALPQGEVVRLGMQLAEGLAAAHDHGVIHRDLKPRNLMVTPDGRLKILDFGLAKLRQSSPDREQTQSLTAAGVVQGTVPYMPPEQLMGHPADQRSDIYAAGAVLYEMATGQRPFPQKQQLELIGAIIHQPPDQPSSHNHQLLPDLERVVLRALEKDPGRRYQSARELYSALEGIGPSAGVRPGRAWALAAVAATAALSTPLILDIGGVRQRAWSLVSTGSGGRTARIESRQSVAVLGFRNVAGRADDAWLSTALAEMMTTELAAGEQLRAVAGESVARMKVNLSLPDAESYSGDTLARIRDNLDADHVVLGSFVPLESGQLRLDLRLQDTNEGEILLATSVRGGEAEIDDLVARAGAALRDRLGVSRVSEDQALAVRATRPENREAARQYSTGLQQLRQLDYQRARESFERALAADPGYALAHSALAAAWRGLGYDRRASEEAKRAFDLSSGFSREERLWIEGQYHEFTNQWAEAERTYAVLAGFFPDNLDYGLRLASAQIAAGRGKQAFDTTSSLRALRQSASEDPRLDLIEAAASAALGEVARQQVLADRAATRATAHGARLLAAQARVSECSALRYLGRPSESIERCDEARSLFAAAGDRSGVARALNAIAVARMEQGDLAGARRAYDDALLLTREIGDKKLGAMVLNNMAGVLRGQVDLTGSRTMLEEALDNFRAIDDRSGVARALDNIGIVLLDEGQPAAARARYEESLVISREIGNRNLTAQALYLLSEVQAVQADLASALTSQTEALAIRREIRDEQGLAQSELAMAALLLESGQFAEAASAARARVDQFRQAGAADDEARARAVLARTLLAQGNVAEARTVIDGAAALVAKSEDPRARLGVRIEAARVNARSGDRLGTAAAMRTLEAVVGDAAREGVAGLTLHARLALGELELSGGDPASARTQLASLETEARTKGFVLLANRAATARR